MCVPFAYKTAQWKNGEKQSENAGWFSKKTDFGSCPKHNVNWIDLLQVGGDDSFLSLLIWIIAMYFYLRLPLKTIQKLQLI